MAVAIVAVIMVNLPAGDNETYSAVKVALEKQSQARGYKFEGKIVTTNGDDSKDIVSYAQTEDWDIISGYREVEFMQKKFNESEEGSLETDSVEYSTRVVRYLEDFWYLVEYADEGTPNTKMTIDRDFAELNIPNSGKLDPVGDLRYGTLVAYEGLLDFVGAKDLDSAKNAIQKFNSQNSGTTRELILKSEGGEFSLSLKEKKGDNYVVWTAFVKMNSVDRIVYQSYTEEPDGSVVVWDFCMTIEKNMKQFNTAIMLWELDEYVDIDELVTLRVGYLEKTLKPNRSYEYLK